MTLAGWIQIIIYFVILILLVKPLGLYMSKVYQGEHTVLSPVIGPIERFIYRLAGIQPADEMDWKDYAKALLLFSGIGFAFLYFLLRNQANLPLNPLALPNVSPALAVNTAVSFITNTNWQNYGGVKRPLVIYPKWQGSQSKISYLLHQEWLF